MKPVTVWLLRHFPYSFLVRHQSLFLRLSVAVFIAALLFATLNTEKVHTGLLAAFSFAFLLIFISSYLPRKETKVSSLVTQTGALELIDLSPLPVFTYEKRANDIYIRFANHACHNMLAEGSKSLIGKPINQLVMLEDEEEMMMICLDTLKSNTIGDNHTFYIRSRTPDGKVIKLMCVTSKVKWLEEYIGICFLFDISQPDNQYAEMQAHMHEGYMSTLVAGIVHDFRNVLTSIIGTAEALQFTIGDKKAEQQLNVIIDAGERGSNTITELLHLNSPETSETETVEKDISKDLKSIFSLLRLQLPVHVKLNYNIENDLPCIRITTSELEQTLMNLVNNATQAMDKDYGVISIHVTQSLAKNSSLNTMAVEITVSDNGKGIAKEDIPKVTENFWTSRKKTGGTGLGLAMVKRIVTNLGGKLRITSELGVGTQVTMRIPTAAENKVQMTQKDSPFPVTITNKSSNTPPTLFEAQPCTILLVDDQPSVLHIQQMLLEAMGHTVITSLNGQEAIKTFEKNKDKVEILVTDFKMPDMDGLSLAESVRGSNPNLPVLMVTAYGEAEKLRRAEDMGVTIIFKPTNLDKLSKAITETQLKYPDIFS